LVFNARPHLNFYHCDQEWNFPTRLTTFPISNF